MEVYYKRGNVIVRDAVVEDIDILKDNIRDSDKQELWASHHIAPEEALRTSLKKASFCLTIEINKEPIGMMGICPGSILDDNAVIWMLSSDKIDNVRRSFARHSREYINKMLEKFSLLYNFVDARNKESLKWLRWCGAKIYEAKPYGIEKIPFHYFEFRRGDA